MTQRHHLQGVCALWQAVLPGTNWGVDRRERGREARAGAGLDICECRVGRSHHSPSITHLSCPWGQLSLPEKHTRLSHPAPQSSPLTLQPSSQRIFNTVQEVPKSLSQGLTLCPVQAEFEIVFTHRYTWPSFKTCAAS